MSRSTVGADAGWSTPDLLQSTSSQLSYSSQDCPRHQQHWSHPDQLHTTTTTAAQTSPTTATTESYQVNLHNPEES